MRYYESRSSYLIWGVSLAAAIVLFVVFSVRGAFAVSWMYLVPLEQSVNNILTLLILVIITLPALVEYNNNGWKQSVNTNIPKLLRDTTEAVRSGIPLVQALDDASARDYGPISKSLELAIIKFKLTTEFEESMTWLGKSLVQPSAKRMCAVLIEAYESGGRIIDVLETSVKLFTHLVDYREERNIILRPYILIMYLGNFIFLFIAWMILTRFMMPLTIASTDALAAQTSFTGNIFVISYYKAILFWSALMNGFFGGLIAGKMGYGKLKTGLVHSVLLIIIATIFFNLFTV